MDPKIVEVTISPWRESSYYEDAEKYLPVFWGEQTIFYNFFKQLDLVDVVELACGKGRHSERVVKLCGRLTLVDVFPEHIGDCAKRLSGNHNVTYIVNNGYDISQIDDASRTAIFCYDAMVHFAPEIVESYLKDVARILRPGGRALFHYSYYAPAHLHYGQNPHARNKMTSERFVNLARQAGLREVRTEVIGWGGVAGLDAVSLLEK